MKTEENKTTYTIKSLAYDLGTIILDIEDLLDEGVDEAFSEAILEEGASAIEFFLEIDLKDVPVDLVAKCDEIHSGVMAKYPDKAKRSRAIATIIENAG